MDELTPWEREQIQKERCKLRRRGREYYAPLLKELTAHVEGRPRVLSVGCGIAEDVEALQEAGLAAFGVDPGFRVAEWTNGPGRPLLIQADGKRLPFRDAAFDVVMSSGVVEHVGAVGATTELLPDYYEQRIAYAQEMVRVTKPGGHIVMDTPNKRFPVDAWHGPYLLWGRWHSPWEKFLASYGEIRDLFVVRGGARSMEALGLQRFFVFENIRRRALGRIAERAARGLFWLVDRPGLKWVRRSWLIPYIVVKITR